MARVNPPPNIKIPKQFLVDRETRAYFEKKDFIMFQVWKRLGGGDDHINNLQNLEITEASAGSQALDAIQYLEQIEDAIPSDRPVDFYSAIKTSSYTAVNGDFIEAQNNAIITLDPEADIDDQIMIANGDGSTITVKGAIKYTKLDSSLIMNNQGTSLHFQNFGDYWRVR